MTGAQELVRCRQWIEDALAYSGGTHDFDDVAEAIADSRMQLWPAPRGCGVTQIVVYPKKKVLHVFLAAGEMDQLLDMIEAAAAWGKAQGCTGMTMSGRKGWERVLAKHGWAPFLSVMEREV